MFEGGLLDKVGPVVFSVLLFAVRFVFCFKLNFLSCNSLDLIIENVSHFIQFSKMALYL